MDPQHDDIPDDPAPRRVMRDWAPGPPTAEEQARLDALKEKRERRDREHYQKLLAAGRKLREAEAREREGGSTRHSSTRKKGHKKHHSKDEGGENGKSGKHAAVVEGEDKGHGNGGEEEERRRRRAARKAKRAEEHPEEVPRASTLSATPEDKASRPSKHSKHRPRPSVGSHADEHAHDAAGPSTSSAAARLSVDSSGAAGPSSSKSVRLSVGSDGHQHTTSRPSSTADRPSSTADRPSSTAADPRLSSISHPSTNSSQSRPSEDSHLSHETSHSHDTSQSEDHLLTPAEAREELDRVFSMAPHLSTLNRMGSRSSVLYRSASKSSLHVPATYAPGAATSGNGLERSNTNASLARSNTTGSNLTRANTTGSNLASSNTTASTVGRSDTTSTYDSPYLIYRTPRPRPEGSISRFAARHSGEGERPGYARSVAGGAYAGSLAGGGGSVYGGGGSAYARSIAGGATCNGGYARSITGGPTYYGGGGGGSTYNGSGAYARSCGTLLDHHGRASTDGAYNRPSYDAAARPTLHRVYSESDFSLPPDPFDDEEPSIAQRIVDKMRSISSLRTLAKKDKRF
ncbi:hypothetical protein K523DRAFT_374549 [Schizophyllum commune Tattone D]|nr:hypothetical protein K523DRAFT_374549 [Schizophyllum commune Tattone D]